VVFISHKQHKGIGHVIGKCPDDNTTHLNSQEVKFGDTLSVPTNDGKHILQ